MALILLGLGEDDETPSDTRLAGTEYSSRGLSTKMMEQMNLRNDIHESHKGTT